MIFHYTINTDDWSNGAKKDRWKCHNAMQKWFDNLSDKTKLAIFYSQKFEYDYGDPYLYCPWSKMIKDAEIRIKEKYAPYALKANGHNLFLHVHFVHEDALESLHFALETVKYYTSEQRNEIMDTWLKYGRHYNG